MGNRIGSNNRQAFSSALIGQAFGVTINATGNAIVTFPASDVLKYRVTKITVWAPSATCATAVVSVGTAAGGGSLLTDGSTALASMTANTKCQDLVLAAGVSTSIQTANKLYFNVVTNVAAVTMNVSVYGDILAN